MPEPGEYPLNFINLRNIPFEPIRQNTFLPFDEQEIALGRPMAWEVMAGPRLIFEVQCPDCEENFELDYYGGRIDDNDRLKCPGCGRFYYLAADDVRELFEQRLKAALDEAGDDPAALKAIGETVAKAAILLEPLFALLVVGFGAELTALHLGNTASLLSIIDQYFRLEHTLVAFPPRPEQCANQYVHQLWSNTGRFIMTPAALTAFSILRELKGQNFDNPTLPLPSMFTGLDRNLPPKGKIVLGRPPRFKGRHNRHLIDLRESYWLGDGLGLVRDHPPLFRFTPEEEEIGQAWLAEHGLTDGYAAFIGRDADFLKPRYLDADWSYFQQKDMDIQTFLPAMRWLGEQGLPSVRLASAQEKPLSGPPPGVVDLAARPRGEASDFLDLYLAAKARFVAAIPTGLELAAYLNHRPVLCLNVTDIGPLPVALNGPDVFIMPKKIWDAREQKYLTILDIFQRKVDCLAHLRQQPHLTAEDNSPEDILAAVQEMYARFVSGAWEDSEDEARQRIRFTKVYSQFCPNFAGRARAVFSFFNENSFLLYNIPV